MAEGRVQRRLAAILAADVAGYSRLMGVDEEGTLARLKAILAELVDPAIAARNGRVVKTTGDGLLAEFASVVDAVRCAVEIQDGMAGRNVAEPDHRRIAFRIGVNLGDIILDGDDIHGDGVNVAARLEALAEPGGICISRAARDQVRDRLDLELEDLGEQSVKNIARPVRVFRVRVAAPAAPAAAQPAAPERPSIAVLPFVNMSGDPEQEYFSDGITEDIITDLSKVSALFVIARNSSFTYKGRAVKVPEVCRELGVAHVLEGSVRKAGNRVRVTAQLIEGKTGGHVWAERYDRDLADVFAVQDELTREIVGALKVQLTPDEAARVGAAETENLEAYDLALRAMAHYNRFTPDANSEAQVLVGRALEIAPGYARAHALLARLLCQVGNLSLTSDPQGAFDRAYEVACKAVDLDGSLAQAHQSKGFVAMWRRRHDEAVAEMDLALRLEPSDADSHRYRSMIHSWGGDPVVGIGAGEAAIRLDPHNAINYFALGMAYYEAARYDDAQRTLRRAITRQPDLMPSLFVLAPTLVALGEVDEARQVVTRILELNPRITLSLWRKTLPYRDPKRLERMLANLAAVGVPE